MLSDAEFEALKTMCADDPDVEEFDFLYQSTLRLTTMGSLLTPISSPRATR